MDDELWAYEILTSQGWEYYNFIVKYMLQDNKMKKVVGSENTTVLFFLSGTHLSGAVRNWWLDFST